MHSKVCRFAVKTRIDAKNQTTTYAWDALNRLTQITYNDGSITALTYDQTTGGNYGVGRLTGMTDSSGSTTWAYDANGHVVQKVVTIAHLTSTLITSYSYSTTTGQIQSMTLPSGNIIGYTWTNGQITALSLTPSGGTATALVSSIVYQPFAGPTSWTFANGEVATRTYDLDGRISADPVDSVVGYDAASRVSGWTLGNFNSQTGASIYGYDNINRLTTSSGIGSAITLGYDEYAETDR